jgi:uncharacterized membrane protein
VSWAEAAVRWYLVLAAVTWAFFPAVSWLCRALPDRGATLARPITMLAALYPAWLLASLHVAPFGTPAVLAVLIVAAVLGWSFVLRRQADRAWLRSLILVEATSLLLFAAYVWLRGYTPQILGTEKPMDVAFLASSTRAVTIPPPDPWFAGQPINYYYLGYLLHGAIGRLAGVAPEIGFNLALATVFCTTAVAAFGVAWNVVRPWRGPRLAAAAGCSPSSRSRFRGISTPPGGCFRTHRARSRPGGGTVSSASAGAPAASSATASALKTAVHFRPRRRSTSFRSSASCWAIFTPT